jgi:hypothetical protein
MFFLVVCRIKVVFRQATCVAFGRATMNQLTPMNEFLPNFDLKNMILSY